MALLLPMVAWAELTGESELALLPAKQPQSPPLTCLAPRQKLPQETESENPSSGTTPLHLLTT